MFDYLIAWSLRNRPFVLATALRGARATILHYHQAVDHPSKTCVTCAAVLFTSES